MDERAKRKLREVKRRKRRQKILMTKFLFAATIMMFVLLAARLITQSMEEDLSQNMQAQNMQDQNKQNQNKQDQNEQDSIAENEKEMQGEEAEPVVSEPLLSVEEKLEAYAAEHGFSVEDYPERVVKLFEKTDDAEDFVLNYPLKRGQYSQDDLTSLEMSGDIPLLLQWDTRWGYFEYGSDVLGVTGCGPTCMSMVASYLLGNASLTPVYMAKFSAENGYVVDGGGTTWNLMSIGAEKLGLTVNVVPLHEATVLKYLQEGYPIICNVGPGYFTEGGHYIVFAGCVDGQIIIHDPNSKANSEKYWDFADIADQIKNMWAYSR